MKASLLAIAVVLVSTQVFAARPATKLEKASFCEAISKRYEMMETETGIDLEKCKKNLNASAQLTGQSPILQVTGKVKHYHMDDSWVSDCRVSMINSQIYGDIDCVPEGLRE